MFPSKFAILYLCPHKPELANPQCSSVCAVSFWERTMPFRHSESQVPQRTACLASMVRYDLWREWGHTPQKDTKVCCDSDIPTASGSFEHLTLSCPKHLEQITLQLKNSKSTSVTRKKNHWKKTLIVGFTMSLTTLRNHSWAIATGNACTEIRTFRVHQNGSNLMNAACTVAGICCKSKQKTVCKHVHVMQINGSNRASKAELLSSTHLHGCRNPCTGNMSEHSKYTRMAATAPAASCLMSATCTVAAICPKSKQKTVCKHVHVMQINSSNRASKAELLSSTHLHGCRNPCTGIMSEHSKYTRMAATAPAASCLMSVTCKVAAICCKLKQKTVCKRVHVMQINGSNRASKAELLSSTHLHGCRNPCTGIMSEHSKYTRMAATAPAASCLMSATCTVAAICRKSKQKTVCKHVHVMQINGSNRASKAELLSSTHLHGCRNPCTGNMSEHSKYTRMAATAPAASCLMGATCTVAAICRKSKQKTVCKHVHVMQINGSNRTSKAELLSSTHLHGCRNPCTGIMSEHSKYTRMAATAPAASCLMSATCTVAAICPKSKQKTVCKYVHVMQINGSNRASKAELLSSTHLHGCRNPCTGIMSEHSKYTRMAATAPAASCLMSATCTVAAICPKSKQKTVCKHVHVMQINGSNRASKAELLSSTHLHGCRNPCTGNMSEHSKYTRMAATAPAASCLMSATCTIRQFSHYSCFDVCWNRSDHSILANKLLLNSLRRYPTSSNRDSNDQERHVERLSPRPPEVAQEWQANPLLGGHVTNSN